MGGGAVLTTRVKAPLHRLFRNISGCAMHSLQTEHQQHQGVHVHAFACSKSRDVKNEVHSPKPSALASLPVPANGWYTHLNVSARYFDGVRAAESFDEHGGVAGQPEEGRRARRQQLECEATQHVHVRGGGDHPATGVRARSHLRGRPLPQLRRNCTPQANKTCHVTRNVQRKLFGDGLREQHRH